MALLSHIRTKLTSIPLLFSHRMKSNTVKKCIPIQHLFPRCHPKNPDLNKCLEDKTDYESAVAAFPFRHLIETNFCCEEECPDRPPRFDDLYYIPSDKATRLYRRTWTLCKSPLCKPKKFCCYEEKSIPYKKRKRGQKVKGVACESQESDVLMQCRQQKRGDDCPTFFLPFCKPSRRPPSCHKVRPPKECIKICAPYPSFSECDKNIKRRKYKECYCYEKPSLCEIYAMMKLGKLKPPKKFKIR